ncbi:MAG TPA: FxsA family protein [Desulfarculaceae bacterium]|nr:FxsA family protein [Desulfarculaceae bacterium]
MLKLFLAFTLVPALEIFLFIRLGGAIGIFNTFLVVILTGVVGAGLARWQGAETMFRIRQSLNQGETPAEEMIDAGLIFVAGMVLLTPGFLTDAIGILLLWPVTRRHFKIFLRRKFDQWMASGQINIVRYR